jgi:hypothetical protein
VGEERRPVPARPGEQCLRPRLPAEHRQVDTGHDRVTDRVEDLVLRTEVVVQRRRLNSEFAGEPAGGERVQPFGVDDRGRHLDDASATQQRLPWPDHLDLPPSDS